ncbi:MULTISPECIES: YceI family protein [Niastella]|uniref:YceI family protein n=1 Tax=Niastella soli TaxID=2821487 RepID=A0ABS3YP74_9BACT|nr:YceI family protein [Niastella soli]MBO9199407.1 YceI family protein [Niastella soli]
MKTLARTTILFLALFLTFTLSIAHAQTKHESAGSVKLVIKGTSNVHDWDMKSDQGSCSSVFDITKAGTLNGVSYINFTVPAESLKSFSTYMDKHAYEALNTDKYNNISFTASSINVKPNGGTGYLLTAKGKLTISSVTKDVVITATGNMHADKSIRYTGAYKLKMTDYNVQPPGIMEGAVKSDDFITVKFDLLLRSI